MHSYIVEYNSDFIEDIKETATYITNVLKMNMQQIDY